MLCALYSVCDGDDASTSLIIYASFWHDHNIYTILLTIDVISNQFTNQNHTAFVAIYSYYIIHFTHMPLITWYQREIIKIMLSWINIWAGYTCWYITNNRTAHAFRYNITITSMIVYISPYGLYYDERAGVYK